MELTALLLSRLQFAFTVSFHIIFPSFTIGLAAWLTVFEALRLATGRPAYRLVFEFWLKIFGIAFGLGVVSGIVMALQVRHQLERAVAHVRRRSRARCCPTRPSLLSRSRPASSACCCLAGRACRRGSTCFRPRWWRWAPCLSAFWIMVNNSWMQVPVGYVVENGIFVPNDWAEIIFSPVVWVRFPHMLLASFLTGAFCVAATGAWYLLRGICQPEARIMLRMGLYLAAVLVPVQLFFGHLTGDYVHDYQPAKFAAIEGRWHDEQPGRRS